MQIIRRGKKDPRIEAECPRCQCLFRFDPIEVLDTEFAYTSGQKEPVSTRYTVACPEVFCDKTFVKVVKYAKH